MADRDPETTSRLVALAREKAKRCGTTLESELEAWLAHYVEEPDEETYKPADGDHASSWSKPRLSITRAIDSISKAGSSANSGRNTRNEAYRRLHGVINDSSKRTS